MTLWVLRDNQMEQREISNLHSLVGDKGFEMKVSVVWFVRGL
jgi:hypothetical protein